jgi:hypothetical protein
MLHWLILIPYYFFLALTVSLLLVLLARFSRVRVPANYLVSAAVLLAIGAVALPLVTGRATLADYTARGFVVLAAASFLLATLDTILASVLPLPLDQELKGL